MPTIEWSDAYETGDPHLDAQHRALFALLNSLRSATVSGNGIGALDGLLAELKRYVTEHFAAEEHLMNSAAYPGAARHTILHDALATKALELIQRLKSRRVSPGPTVAQSLAELFSEHVQAEDLKMIQWVKTHSAANSTATSESSLKTPLEQLPSGTMTRAARRPSGDVKQRPSGVMPPAKEGRLHDALMAARESVGRLRVEQERKSREK